LVNWEELDDEEVIICPARPPRRAVVLQPNAGISFAIILDDDVRCLEVFQEACVMGVVPEGFGTWPLGAEDAPLSIVAPTAM
jgi:hypothetical protein